MTDIGIGHTWDGAALPPSAHTRLRVALDDRGLRIEVDAPFAGDPPPSGPPGSHAELWEHEVVELFVAGEDGRYTEIELSPHGHHLVLQLDGVRRVVASGLPLRFSAQIDGDRWRGVAHLDRALLPAHPTHFNAYRIGGGRFEAHAAVPGEAPDFHQPARFVPWAPADPVAVGTVYCIGRNYAAHAAELGNAVPSEPVVFLKAAASVRGLQPAPLAFPEERPHHEVELVLRLGAPVGLGETAGWEVVDAVTLGLDLTRRPVQARCKEAGHPWTAAKSFAGSAVLGPFLRREALGDPAALRFSLWVQGALKQEGDPGLMLFDVPAILAHLASLNPLRSGDLVFTGTPRGVGPIAVGDAFRMQLRAAGGTWDFAGVL